MIHIPEPCTADWKGMTPQKDGRFCSSCEKVVVDFTKMSDEDIKGYFATHTEQKTCGRFEVNQINRPLEEKPSSMNVWYTRIQATSYRPLFKNVALFFVGSLIWFSSCVRKTAQVMGEMVADDSSRYCQPHHLTGDTTYISPEMGKVMYLPEDTVAAPADTLDQGSTIPEDSSTHLMGKPVPFKGRSKGKKF